MAFVFSTTLNNNMLDEITTAIDSGVSAGLMRIYDGTRPARGAAITTEVLLAELTFSDPSALAAATDVWTAEAITSETSAPDSGIPEWGRIVNSGGTFQMDFDVGHLGSEDAVLDEETITIGDNVGCAQFTHTSGNT